MPGEVFPPSLRAQAEHEIEKLADKAGTDLLGGIPFFQLACGVAEQSALLPQLKVAFEWLREIDVDSGGKAFPNAGIYMLGRKPAVLARLKLMSVLIRVQHDVRLAAGEVEHLKQASDQGESTIFGSGMHLHDGHYLLDPYVGPLLGALSPGVWGFASYRPHGPLLLSFGQPIAGTSDTAPELLRTLFNKGPDEVTTFDPISAEAIPAAVKWWGDRLDDLFEVITDWSLFATPEGVYHPATHLEFVATVEQIFRRTLSIQATHSDRNVRQVLLFNVVDSLNKVLGRDLEAICNLKEARKALDRLEESLPPAAAEVLLPNARRAVEALEKVADGFFLREETGAVYNDPQSGRPVDDHRAATKYLSMIRNSAHGHSTNRESRSRQDRILMARHTGELPHDLAMLAWLNLLTVMNESGRIRERLRRQSPVR